MDRRGKPSRLLGRGFCDSKRPERPYRGSEGHDEDWSQRSVLAVWFRRISRRERKPQLQAQVSVLAETTSGNTQLAPCMCRNDGWYLLSSGKFREGQIFSPFVPSVRRRQGLKIERPDLNFCLLASSHDVADQVGPISSRQFDALAPRPSHVLALGRRVSLEWPVASQLATPCCTHSPSIAVHSHLCLLNKTRIPSCNANFRDAVTSLIFKLSAMAWGGDDDRRPETDEGEEELDETVRSCHHVRLRFPSCLTAQ
jgi:hypothetical protein